MTSYICFNNVIVDLNKIIIYEGIKYYLATNYYLNNDNNIIINYGDRSYIYRIDPVKYNNQYILFCYFNDKQYVDNVKVDGFYILVNNVIKLKLQYITQDATFRTRTCTLYFDDYTEYLKDDFEYYSDNEVD